ncbi:hypothetical protein Q5752_004374 [Cryptotrichosporon argae]
MSYSDKIDEGKEAVVEVGVEQLYDNQAYVADDDAAAARRLFSYEDAQRLKRKVDLRILPVLFIGYLCRGMCQNMASYVKAMNTGTDRNILSQLDMTTDAFAWASTAYSITYTITEIPSNMTIRWATPRIHLARILALWSIIAACHAACQNGASFLALRALLGLAEGGFYPGILYLFNAWYRPDEMAFRVFAIGTLGQFSGVVDTMLAYGFSFTDNRVAGWRYCYIVVGCIGLVTAAAMFWILPDYPDSPPSRRNFLTAEEGAFMSARLPPSAGRAAEHKFDGAAIWAELRSPLFWGYGLSVFGLAAGTSGLTFWLPTILEDFNLTSSTQSLLLNVPPSILYVIVQLSAGWFMDHDTRVPRHLIMIVCSIWLVAGYLGLMYIKSPGGSYAMIFIVYIPYACYYGMIYPLRTQSLKPGSASVALAGLNTFACIPDFFTAQFFQDKYAPRYIVPFVICLAFCAFAGIAIAVTWYFAYDNEKQTRMVARERRKIGKETNAVSDLEVTAR